MFILDNVCVDVVSHSRCQTFKFRILTSSSWRGSHSAGYILISALSWEISNSYSNSVEKRQQQCLCLWGDPQQSSFSRHAWTEWVSQSCSSAFIGPSSFFLKFQDLLDVVKKSWKLLVLCMVGVPLGWGMIPLSSWGSPKVSKKPHEAPSSLPLISQHHQPDSRHKEPK